MPQPKKRHNHSRTNRRRSHHALKGVEKLSAATAHRLKKYFDLETKKFEKMKEEMLQSNKSA